jgi:hypothetical protein
VEAFYKFLNRILFKKNDRLSKFVIDFLSFLFIFPLVFLLLGIPIMTFDLWIKSSFFDITYLLISGFITYKINLKTNVDLKFIFGKHIILCLIFITLGFFIGWFFIVLFEFEVLLMPLISGFAAIIILIFLNFINDIKIYRYVKILDDITEKILI